MQRRATGAQWEAFALDYLMQRGLTPVARNFHSRFGEIDLIMTDAGALVFVEVRFRGGDAGRPCAAETIDERKQRRLWRTAEFFLLRNPSWHGHVMRFDVIAIDTHDGAPPRVQWLRDAFRPG